MDKLTGSGDQSTEIKIWPMENCRFAYTLGTSQPVRCSWISDQPLFYADCEEAEDEDYLMEDDPLMQALERDIADLRHKTDAYDKLAMEYKEPENHMEALFASDAVFISSAYKASPSILTEELELLHQSRLASQMMSFAQVHNIAIRETSHIVGASYDRSSHSILVRADLDTATKLLLITRELRAMWQHKNGAGLHPLAVHPDYAVLINRAQQADLMVAMIRTAWELQLAGFKDAWMRVEHSPLMDLGRAFAREAVTDFRSINNGIAAQATFESWFLSERCRKADRTLIQQMLADYQGYVFSDNVETSRLITLDLIKALGKMPFGSNYLEKIAVPVTSDPVFTDVRDRANANFLWFIKFERSFSEAEKTMPQKSDSVKPVSAEIIAFPKQKKSAKKSKKISGENPAEIVEIFRA